MKNEITAKRLKFAMERAGLRSQDLADKSGVHKSSISQYVNGSHSPSNISSGKMAAVLNVNPVWLMGFDVPMEIEDSQKSKKGTSTRTTVDFSDLDKEIIKKFHESDEITQAMVLRVLGLDEEKGSVKNAV